MYPKNTNKFDSKSKKYDTLYLKTNKEIHFIRKLKNEINFIRKPKK